MEKIPLNRGCIWNKLDIFEYIIDYYFIKRKVGIYDLIYCFLLFIYY